jgi:hypothetical protein
MAETSMFLGGDRGGLQLGDDWMVTEEETKAVSWLWSTAFTLT